MIDLQSSNLVLRGERRDKIIEFVCCCLGVWLLMGIVFIAFYEGAS
jgi:uncharacterized membrane protein